MHLTRTHFGDLRAQAIHVYRVQTESSVYHLAIHEEHGKKTCIVRGQAGSDRENVVIRDSDPRIGDRSLFDVPPVEWVGKILEVATMRTSPITFVHREGDPLPPEANMKTRVNAPDGLGANPRIVPVPARGTSVGNPRPAPTDLARQLVTGQADPQQAAPYPLRHVLYAEDVVTRLRSIHRRDRLWHDLSTDPKLQDRLMRALDGAEQLLADIKKRIR
ncbi:MAG: hypothetical protein JO257_37920 [Deltaproteobacteria bacterium]|nr:hypothetical protein [Deltaproteobacteria bacterium]